MAGALWTKDDALHEAGRPHNRRLCRLWEVIQSPSECNKKPLKNLKGGSGDTVPLTGVRRGRDAR